ncbi:transcription factor IBH1-like 1 [Solanum stenotomum]|uniref:transcription factor IBH1-like 1 n=1 Tax=Solanum stenotomum TaxID=172797 RepID=UPI0020D031C4|nr:transcription factor IBH1-like 1 [Solanum stenotomum]
MRNPNSLKQEFLKKWIKGLQICSATKKKMSIMERKKAIKLSADIAMASTRKSTIYWSHALMKNASKDDTNKVIIKNILGSNDDNNNNFNKVSMGIYNSMSQNGIIRSKKIIKKSCKISRRARKNISPSIIAKKMVEKRTKVLKSLVPGGEYMDDASLIKETLDYIISLRVQVDVMRHLANNASCEINDPKTNL